MGNGLGLILPEAEPETRLRGPVVYLGGDPRKQCEVSVREAGSQ